MEQRVSEEAAELQKRYLQLPQSAQRFSPQLFHSLLQAEAINYARQQLLAAPAELNRDAQPVTYYLNMLLWGQFSGSNDQRIAIPDADPAGIALILTNSVSGSGAAGGAEGRGGAAGG